MYVYTKTFTNYLATYGYTQLCRYVLCGLMYISLKNQLAGKFDKSFKIFCCPALVPYIIIGIIIKELSLIVLPKCSPLCL